MGVHPQQPTRSNTAPHSSPPVPARISGSRSLRTLVILWAAAGASAPAAVRCSSLSRAAGSSSSLGNSRILGSREAAPPPLARSALRLRYGLGTPLPTGVMVLPAPDSQSFPRPACHRQRVGQAGACRSLIPQGQLLSVFPAGGILLSRWLTENGVPAAILPPRKGRTWRRKLSCQNAPAPRPRFARTPRADDGERTHRDPF